MQVLALSYDKILVKQEFTVFVIIRSFLKKDRHIINYISSSLDTNIKTVNNLVVTSTLYFDKWFNLFIIIITALHSPEWFS